MSDRAAISAIAALRASLGVGAIVAPVRTARLFGFPDERITPTARLLGRWFGVRELVLAALAVAGHGGPRVAGRPRGLARRELRRRERQFAALNVANDAVDAAAMLVPVLRRDGIDRPQLVGVPVALAVSAGWLRVLRRRA